MPEGDSPTIARRRVRMALREAREAAELTQQQVADEMEWSLSKVIRIENGDVSIAPNDLRPLLTFIGIKDRVRVAELLAEAKIARARQRRAWYQAQEYRETLTEPLRRLIEYEAEAAAIHSFSVFHFPGLLQTPEYSAALMRTWDDDDIGPRNKHYRLEARRLRQETVIARLDRMRFTVLLDEAVFMRPVGGARVFAKQLRRVLHLNDGQQIEMRMVPFTMEAAGLSYWAVYDLLYLDHDGADSNAVMYRENGMTDDFVEDPRTISKHFDRYQKLWDAAMDGVDTNDFVKRRIEELEQ
jgi:transcriptional regulator with XRE-family HTH domain